MEARIAASIADALEWKARLGPDARFIAGGSDLVLRLPRLAPQPLCLIQLPVCRETVTTETGVVRIPALANLANLAVDPVLQRTFPVVCQAFSQVGSPQIRNVATLAGNLANASPACDSAPALMVYEGRAVLQSLTASRVVPLAEFFVGPGRTVIAHDELLVAVEVPVPDVPDAARERSRFSKFGPRGSNVIASANIAMRLVVAEGLVALCRLCAGSVAPVPLRLCRVEGLLETTTISRLRDAALLDELRQLLDQEIRPISDVRGSDWYKRRVIELALVEFLECVADRCSEDA